MRRRVTDWLDERRLDNESYEDDHPYAAASGRMSPATEWGFTSWLIWVILDASGFYRWRERRRERAEPQGGEAASPDGE